MKWVDAKAIPWRISKLFTRRFGWTDEAGQVDWVKEDWKTTWRMVGIHTYTWWWVRRYGQLDCGCSRNPLTRRMVLYDFKCQLHCGFARFRATDDQELG